MPGSAAVCPSERCKKNPLLLVLVVVLVLGFSGHFEYEHDLRSCYERQTSRTNSLAGVAQDPVLNDE